MKRLLLIIMLLVLGLAVIGCGGEKPSVDKNESQDSQGAETIPPSENPSTPETKPVPEKPVELVFYGMSILPELDQGEYLEYVQRKYPHISFKFINNEGETRLDQILLTQTQVDILFGSFASIATAASNGLLGTDIGDLVKKHNYDLNRFEQSYLDLFRSLDNGNLTGLPYYDLRGLLYYNLDLFDKFAIDYPANGVTWEEIITLSRRLTREESGVQYRGLIAAPSLLAILDSSAAPIFDPATNQPLLLTDAWKKNIEMMLPLYTMQGYKPEEALGKEDLFFKEKSAAMIIKMNSDVNTVNQNIDNWDATTYPELSSHPGVGSQPYPVYLAISSLIPEEKRDAAFLAITQLLSDEIQMERSANKGLATPLKSNEVKSVFAKHVEAWGGKNISAVTSQVPAASVPYSEFNNAIRGPLNQAMNAVIFGEKDLNTALRDADEAANRAIKEILDSK